MNILRMIAYVLVISGALVWGIVGFFDYNIVSAMFGDQTVLSRIIYSLVGIGAVVMLAISGHEECFCENSEIDYR